jgi:hypothetical protein
MAKLIEEQILSETNNTVTIRFSRQNGSYIDREVQKVDGLTNEELLLRWHRRITLEYLQNRIVPSKWNKPDTQ